jgi:hypothetical protein
MPGWVAGLRSTHERWGLGLAPAEAGLSPMFVTVTSQWLAGLVRPSARRPHHWFMPDPAFIHHVRGEHGAHLIRLGELSRAAGRAGILARIGSAFLAPLYGPEQEPRAGAQQCEVAEHLDDQHYPRDLGFCRDVPKTHR